MRKTYRIKFKLSVVILFWFTLLLPAADLHVTTTADNVAGSLREAVTIANGNGEDDVIYLPEGAYRLTGSSGEDANASGDLDIDTDGVITIIGVNGLSTIIDGNGADRVLEIHHGTVRVSKVSFTGGLPGYVGWHYSFGDSGGAVRNTGTLTLTDCFLYNNGTRGGKWSSANGGHGGAIYNVTGGTITLNGCHLYSNTTGNGYDSNEEFENGGSAGLGGGIYNSGAMGLSKCTVYDNATGDMGNYCNWGNFHSSNGGGIYNIGTMTVSQSAIYNNVCGDGDAYAKYTERKTGGSGGGICNAGTLAVTNSTVSGNTTGDGGYSSPYGVGGGGDGGGIYNYFGGTLTLNHCTITGNTTGHCIDGDELYGLGGGVCSGYGLSLGNTIIAGNTAGNREWGADAYGNFSSLGYNLIENTAGCTLDGMLTGNITGQPAGLEALGNNGGPTPTHALQAGSPAIDAGSSFNETVDQRGCQRPLDMPGMENADDGADIGAFEFDTSYTVSGRITDGIAGVPGVTITFEGSGSATTGPEGNYSTNVFYGWSGTAVPSKPGYSFAPAVRTYTNVIADQTGQDYTAGMAGNPEISLSRTGLNFGADSAGNRTETQEVFISNAGGGDLAWTAACDETWLSCSPGAGSGGAELSVAIDAAGLPAGTYGGTVSIADANAVNSPGAIEVTLTVYGTGSSGLPFGSFDSPRDGLTVTGGIAVTGWAVDNIGIAGVRVYRDPAGGGGGGMVYIGGATLVEGARTDIEELYPGYPGNHKAGWGYMMLTNMLPNQGNGTFRLHAEATDMEGNIVSLGTKTITCDNANGVKPFGAIDTPTQGGTISGSGYVNYGWALTPLPNTIPKDGSTIVVWVDGVPLGNPVYNQYREDVEAYFPGLNNSGGAFGYFYIDTAGYPNGRHYIYWTVADDAGNADGIGSRYFNIQNASNIQKASAGPSNHRTHSRTQSHAYTRARVNRIEREAGVPVCFAPLPAAVGFEPNPVTADIYPGPAGLFQLEMNELGRVEVHPGPGCTGYLEVGDKLYPLPVGSTLDRERGIFYWNAGPGFTGTYDIVFYIPGEWGFKKKKLRIRIRVGTALHQ